MAVLGQAHGINSVGRFARARSHVWRETDCTTVPPPQKKPNDSLYFNERFMAAHKHEEEDAIMKLSPHAFLLAAEYYRTVISGWQRGTARVSGDAAGSWFQIRRFFVKKKFGGDACLDKGVPLFF